MGEVVNQSVLLALRPGWRREGKILVFTNDHFDLLHMGHVRSLQQAREAGDMLVVAVNDDASAARRKGPRRPVIPCGERMHILAALACVDYVCSFSEDTPRTLVAQLRPDVYTKGGDYASKPGELGKPMRTAEVVRSYGGTVVVTPLIDNVSTTDIVSRIVERYRN